jgi:hypothetical protein
MMEAIDIRGAHLMTAFLGDMITTPGGIALFMRWVKSEQPDAWERWAQDHNSKPDDVLVADAVLATQAAILEGVRLELDKMGAQAEAQQIIEGGGDQVV